MSERILDDFRPDELTCRQLAELVSDYIEGLLAPSLRTRFVGHLADCEDCTSYVDQMRATIAVTGELPAGDVAPPVRDALLELFRGWAGRRGPADGAALSSAAEVGLAQALVVEQVAALPSSTRRPVEST